MLHEFQLLPTCQLLLALITFELRYLHCMLVADIQCTYLVSFVQFQYLAKSELAHVQSLRRFLLHGLELMPMIIIVLLVIVSQPPIVAPQIRILTLQFREQLLLTNELLLVNSLDLVNTA